MKAVILAGGLGSRLRPAVGDVPKPLAPVCGGKCFLDILIEKLVSCGFDDFIFCLCHMSEKIIERYRNGEELGVRISHSVERLPLGTGGAIGLLRNTLRERFFVFNADTYFSLDCGGMAARHIEKGALVSLALAYKGDGARYGRVETDEGMSVKSFAEKSGGSGGYASAGAYLLEPEIFELIPEGPSSLEKDVFPAVLRAGKIISGYCIAENFIDIGVPEDYRRFIKLYCGGFLK